MELLGVVYYLSGFVFLVLLARRVNHGLSILDLLVCAVGAVVWPVMLGLMGVLWLMFSDNALTKKRFWNDQK